MAESRSRPWLSVPSGKLGLPPDSQAGGLSESSRLTLERSKGSCGAIQGASRAAETSARAMTAASTASLERRKL
jgi:hypothetical protein